MTTERTHKLVLESVTLNFRLWDGPPPAKDRPRWDAPEWSTGRPFATVEVHQLGTYIRTLNEARTIQGAIQRSLTIQELRAVTADIEKAVARVKAANLLDPNPNPLDAEAEHPDSET